MDNYVYSILAAVVAGLLVNGISNIPYKKIMNVLGIPFLKVLGINTFNTDLREIKDRNKLKLFEECFEYICKKIHNNNINNMDYIEKPNGNQLKIIYEILDAIKFTYDSETAENEVLYYMLLKVITQPTNYGDELLHKRILDNLYPYSIHLLYLINKKETLMNQDMKAFINVNSEKIYASKYLNTEPIEKNDYIPIDNLVENIVNKIDSDINNYLVYAGKKVNATKNYLKYFINLENNKLIYSKNLGLKRDEKYRNCVFEINGKEYIYNSDYKIKKKYTYHLTDLGMDILQYYGKNVISKINPDELFDN